MESKKAFERIFGFSLESEPEIKTAMITAEMSPGKSSIDEIMRLMIMRETVKSDIKGIVTYGDPRDGELRIIDLDSGNMFLLDW